MFLEHDVDHADATRYSRWWTAHGAGSVSLPLVMVDSGHAISSGSVDFATVYSQMVNDALARPPLARLQAVASRTGNRVTVVGTLTNSSGVTLSLASNGATIQVLVYEEAHVGVTGRYVRGATSQSITSPVADGATTSFTLETGDLAPADWSRVHVIVLADYRPAGATGAYDMLQATRVSLGGRRSARGDFDGDAISDATVFRPSSGVWYQLRSTTGSGHGVAWGANGDTPVPGDYDGDSTTDAAVFRPASGTWFVLQSTTGTGVGVQWGLADDVPVPADYDGDGKTDVAVWRPSIGVWYIIRSTTNTAVGISWGVTGDIPVPADFDGDGHAEPTVFRPSTGTWYQLRRLTGGIGVTWGQSGDVPLAGDYDGDGRADPSVFRASSGMWYELRSTTGTGFGVLWGTANDVPIVGDYDGDGKMDPTVFRPSSNTWYQLRSTTPGVGYSVVWGAMGDLPQ